MTELEQEIDRSVRVTRRWFAVLAGIVAACFACIIARALGSKVPERLTQWLGATGIVVVTEVMIRLWKERDRALRMARLLRGRARRLAIEVEGLECVYELSARLVSSMPACGVCDRAATRHHGAERGAIRWCDAHGVHTHSPEYNAPEYPHAAPLRALQSVFARGVDR